MRRILPPKASGTTKPMRLSVQGPNVGLNPFRRAAGGGGGDPSFANVSALLHFDGTDGSTTFTDVKGNVWTPYGSAQLDTSQAKFGTASYIAEPFQSSRIRAAENSAFGMGTGAFTIEGWYRPTDFAEIQYLCELRESGAVGCAILARSNIAQGLAYYDNSGYVAGSGAVAFTSNVWTHWAVVREDDGSTVRGYMGGVQRFTTTDARTFAAAPSCWLFGTTLTSGSIFGNCDEVRITKGVCRYPGGTTFTPPDAAFPDS